MFWTHTKTCCRSDFCHSTFLVLTKKHLCFCQHIIIMGSLLGSVLILNNYIYLTVCITHHTSYIIQNFNNLLIRSAHVPGPYLKTIFGYVRKRYIFILLASFYSYDRTQQQKFQRFKLSIYEVDYRHVCEIT